MALVRILVDGFSLLHSCPHIAAGNPRHSAAAREELIRLLTQYRDALGTPITVVFDGASAPLGATEAPSSRDLEILYSKAGQTADQLIERATHRLRAFGEVLVVTDDRAERDTITAAGGLASGCANFVDQIKSTLADLARELKHLNRRELRRFKRTGHV